VFQLSGGTTGIPKLIPRTHNDYVYNSKTACTVTGVGDGKVLLDILPLAHNLPLACPGMQGFLISGGTVVLSTSVRGEDVFRLVQENKVTHIHVVPALLIRWINDPAITKYDLSSLEFIQSGGQRLQPEVRRRTKELIPSVFVQENFGMAEGMLMFVRKDDPEDVRMETVGLPISPDDDLSKELVTWVFGYLFGVRSLVPVKVKVPSVTRFPETTAVALTPSSAGLLGPA